MGIKPGRFIHLFRLGPRFSSSSTGNGIPTLPVLALQGQKHQKTNNAPRVGKEKSNMKATSKNQAPVQVTKEPAMISVREIVPWFIIAIMVFAIAGIISGWFIHVYAVNDAQTTVTIASKALSR